MKVIVQLCLLGLSINSCNVHLKNGPSIYVSRTSISLSNLTGDTDTFTIRSRDPWKLMGIPEAAQSWLKVDKLTGDTGTSLLSIKTISDNNSDSTQMAVLSIVTETDSPDTVLVEIARKKFQITRSALVNGSYSNNQAKIIPAIDGGYLCFGYSPINDQQNPYNYEGYYSGLIIKVDSAFNKVWEQNIGTIGYQCFNAAISTKDGYVLVGYKQRMPGVVDEGAFSNVDAWLVKIDATGKVVSEKTIGDVYSEYLNDIVAIDDGYIVCGSSNVLQQDTLKSAPYPGPTYTTDNGWVLRLNSDLDTLWTKSLGGKGDDAFFALIAAPGGGCILAGSSSSLEINDQPKGTLPPDGWLIHLDSTGQVIWQKTLGGYESEQITDIEPAGDGGLVLTGVSWSNNDRFAGNQGEGDMWFARLDKSGNVQWMKLFGSLANDEGTAIIHWHDGFLIAGKGGYTGHPYSPWYGANDLWLVYIDQSGEIQNQQAFGGSESDYASSVMMSLNNEIIVAGTTYSYNNDLADIRQSDGAKDIWIFELNYGRHRD
jgi:hypothetical protein